MPASASGAPVLGASATSITASGFTVSWTAPVSKGTISSGAAATITGYTVTLATNTTFTQVVSEATQAGLTKAFTGLTAGTIYYVKVVATNSAGLTSAASTVMATSTAPSQVTGLVASPASTTGVTLSWTAPSNGSAAITGYKVEKFLDGGSAWSSVVASTTFTSYTASIVANTGHLFRVSAINSKATGVPSDSVRSGPLPASTPTAVVVAGSLNQVDVTFTDISGIAYSVVPYLNGTTAQAATSPVTLATTGSNTVRVTVANPCSSYTFKVQIYNSDGSAGAQGSAPGTVYPGLSVAAPSGQAYSYTGASYVVGTGTVTYTGVAIADASFALTTVGGSPAWSVTAGGQTDTLIGVKRVIFSDQSAYLFGSGGSSNFGSIVHTAASSGFAASTTNLGGATGDYLLFAGGETYTRSASINVLYLECAVKFVGILDSTGNRPTLRFTHNSNGIRPSYSNTTFTNLIIDGANNSARTSAIIKLNAPSYPLVSLSGISFTNVDFINVGAKRALDFNYMNNITLDGCNIASPDSDPTITFSSCKTVVIKNSTLNASNPTSYPAVVIYSTEASGLTPTVATDVPTMTAALNNTGYDFSQNNTLNEICAVAIRLLSPTNISDVNDPSSLYPVSMTYGISGSVDLLLPTALKYAYSGVVSSYPSAAPAVSIATSTAVSSAELRVTQWPSAYYPEVIVTDLSTGLKIHPAGYEAIPAAPSNVTVTPADSSLSVAWDAVEGVTGYTVSYNSVTVDASASPVTISGLANGTEYSVTVRAKSAAGNGPYSSPAVNATPRGLPGQPGKPTTRNHKDSITVLWGAVEANGNTPTYTVAWGGSVSIGDISGTQYEVPNLSNSVFYKFTVTATNAAGSGLPSDQSDDAQPLSAPPAPENLAVTEGNGQLDISWDAPTLSPPVDSGEEIVGYRITYSTVGVSLMGAPSVTVDVSASPATISGLSNGTSYSVSVQALCSNSSLGVNGFGAASSVVTKTPRGPPSAPAKPTVSTTGTAPGSIKVSWIAPANNGSNISGYTVYWGAESRRAHPSKRMMVLTDLSNSPYSFYVIANSNLGDSPASESSDEITPQSLQNFLSETPIESTVTEEAEKVLFTRIGVLDTGALSNLLTSIKDASVGKTTAQKNVLKAGVNAAILNAPSAVKDSNGNATVSFSGGNSAGQTGAFSQSCVSVSPSFDSSRPLDRVIPQASQVGSTSNTTSSVVMTQADITAINAGEKYKSISMLISNEDATHTLNLTVGSETKALTFDGQTVSEITNSGVVPLAIEGILGFAAFTDVGVFAFGGITFGKSSSNPTGTICFLGNAPVLTPSGYKRIDSLKIGDLVQTATGATVAIQNVMHQIATPSASVNPYIIPKGQFGATENIAISPRHCVVIPGRGYVEARALGLRQLPLTAPFDYYNLVLPNWENMVVGGVTVESLAPKKQVAVRQARMKQILAKAPAHLLSNYRKLFEKKGQVIMMQVPAKRPVA